jgi:hypothetical protein
VSKPAKVIEVDGVDEPPESDAEGAASGVLQRARPQVPEHEEANISESAIAEALTLAARAGRGDVVAQLAATRRFKG